ncbi:MAG: circadian clock protein KaiC [Bacteroidetes bacterium]|nr:circadian clock protein KaiC [Bacteroidota bacterium]
MIKTTKKKITPKRNKLLKCPTGIKGLDEITEGGLPKNRITLVSGNGGSGKTLLGIDFLIKGATDYNEPGILMSFEETEDELFKNVASLNMDLAGLVSRKKIVLDHVILDRKEIQEQDFNLEGIFVRLEEAIDSIGAKRVVLDSLESIFAGVTDTGVLRLEMKRLFRWLKEKQVTAIVTGEQGPNGSFTRHGLEEYISDCIILLDNRVRDQIATRRVRIIKYRGSKHGTSEYPFVIDDEGLSVIPITSAGLEQPGTSKRVSTGIPSLDKLFTGKGYTKGSTILASGTAGSGKTSFAGAFAVESCKRGERCLFFSYEESAGQLTQNMKSIGINFAPWIKKGQLKIVALRPSFLGLEMHLLNVYKLIESFKPKAVVIDPISSLVGEGDEREVSSMITRMIDLFKSRSITTFFTSLVSGTFQSNPSGEIGVSSLIDTWITVRMVEDKEGKKRTREVFIVKSRGTDHSSDVHKFILSGNGIILMPNDGKAKLSANKKKGLDKNIPENEKNK